MSNDAQNLETALAEGDDLAAMRALRRVLAANLIGGSYGRDTVAGLSAEYRNVLAELGKLGATQEASPLNDIARKRAERRAAASDLRGTASA